MLRDAALRLIRPAAPLLVAAGTFAVMIATEPSLAIGWDEGYTLGREARVRSWFRALRAPDAFARAWTPPTFPEGMVEERMTPPRADEIHTRAKLFSARSLTYFWPFGREEPHGHPPFYAIVGLIGDVVVPRWADLPRARFGPMLVFSLAAGAIFGTIRRRWGAWPAMAAAGAWALQPQLFALGHYATYDAILAALWVGAILAFSRAVGGPTPRPRWGSVLLFGILCGWAADTKLTGWFLPLPFLAWTVLARSRRGVLTLIVGGIVAVLTLYAFNPPWWGDPIGGPIRFLQSNLSRGKTIPIRVMFLGTVYRTPVESLPFYNTLVWTVIATPVGFLALAILGAGRSVRARLPDDPLPVLAASHWLFVLILRALPHTPGHDGVRQFLPAFGCLALAAGVGAAWLEGRWRRIGRAVIALAIAEGAVSVAAMMPVPLSYYSPLIGGLPGAARLGMEPTYYWDALSAEALESLESNTPPGRWVWFHTFPTSWIYLKRTGAIRFPLAPIDRSRPALYVVQNRPGEFRPNVEGRLVRDLGPRSVLVAKFGVPLIWAFPYDGEVERLLREASAPAARGSP